MTFIEQPEYLGEHKYKVVVALGERREVALYDVYEHYSGSRFQVSEMTFWKPNETHGLVGHLILTVLNPFAYPVAPFEKGYELTFVKNTFE